MPRIPVTCMVCVEEVEEEKYTEHMKVAHGGKSQLEAIEELKLKEQNTPKIIPLNPEAPIPLEFTQVVNAMETQKPKSNLPTPNPVIPPPTVEIKPLELKYRWEGVCPQCSAPVRTVITKVDGRWFCSAYCITHETLEQREVTPLTNRNM